MCVHFSVCACCVYVSVCACTVCGHTRTCVSSFMWVHMCLDCYGMYKEVRGQPQSYFSGPTQTAFETSLSGLFRALWLVLAGGEYKYSFCLCLGITVHVALCFTWVREIRFRCSCLHSKCLADGAISPDFVFTKEP